MLNPAKLADNLIESIRRKEARETIERFLTNAQAREIVNSQGEIEEDTPLTAACKSLDVGLVNLLIDRGAGANVRNKQQQSPLYNVVWADNIFSEPESAKNIITSLVNNGAYINELTENRRTPFISVLSRMMDANKLEYGLLDHMKQLGSDLNIKDSSKITPLIEVCRYYIDCNMIRYLIHNGADIHKCAGLSRMDSNHALLF